MEASGSVPATPAAPEAPATPAAPTPAEPAAPTPSGFGIPQAPPPAAPAASDDATPDLSREVADLTARLQKVEGGGEGEGEQAPETGLGLFSTLADQPAEGADLTDFLTPQEIAALQAQGALGAGEQEQSLEQRLPELDSYVGERVQKGIEEAVAPIQQERQEEKLAGLEAKYEDITDSKILPQVKATVESLVQRYGDESLKFDAHIVEVAYKAVKAELADTDAAPAEQAATSRAALETSAGRSQQGAADPSEQFADALAGTGGGSVFTQ